MHDATIITSQIEAASGVGSCFAPAICLAGGFLFTED